MKKSKFATVADTVLLHVVVYVAAFLLLRCLLPAIPAYFAALGVTGAFFAAFAFFTRRRGKRAKVPAETVLQFALFPDYARDYFARSLHAAQQGDYLVRDNVLYVPLFSPSPIPFERVAPAYRYAHAAGMERVVYLTDAGLAADANALTALERPKVEVVAGDALATYLQEPVELSVRSKPKSERFALFRHALDRKNARRYLLAALTLFGFSYLVPHAVYYLVFACLSFALGTVCFFRFGHKPDRKKP